MDGKHVISILLAKFLACRVKAVSKGIMKTLSIINESSFHTLYISHYRGTANSFIEIIYRGVLELLFMFFLNFGLQPRWPKWTDRECECPNNQNLAPTIDLLRYTLYHLNSQLSLSAPFDSMRSIASPPFIRKIAWLMLVHVPKEYHLNEQGKVNLSKGCQNSFL